MRVCACEVNTNRATLLLLVPIWPWLTSRMEERKRLSCRRRTRRARKLKIKKKWDLFGYLFFPAFDLRIRTGCPIFDNQYNNEKHFCFSFYWKMVLGITRWILLKLLKYVYASTEKQFIWNNQLFFCQSIWYFIHLNSKILFYFISVKRFSRLIKKKSRISKPWQIRIVSHRH